MLRIGKEEHTNLNILEQVPIFVQQILRHVQAKAKSPMTNMRKAKVVVVFYMTSIYMG